MITVKRLKELLAQIPDTAKLYAYEGEDTGIVFIKEEEIFGAGEKIWFIEATERDDNTFTEGF